jgi:hypothetical protein
VPTVRKDVHFDGNVSLRQRFVETQASFGRHLIVIGRQIKEGRRRIRGGVQARREPDVSLRVARDMRFLKHQIAIRRMTVATWSCGLEPGVRKDDEVRPAAYTLDRVARVGVAGCCP